MAAARIGKLFGDWKRADVASPDFPSTPRRSTRALYLVDRAGSAQSNIIIANDGADPVTNRLCANVACVSVRPALHARPLTSINGTPGWLTNVGRMRSTGLPDVDTMVANGNLVVHS